MAGEKRGGHTRQDEQTQACMHTGNKLYIQNQVHIPTGGLTSTTHASETPVAPVVTNTCYSKKLKPSTSQAQQKKKKEEEKKLTQSSCLVS